MRWRRGGQPERHDADQPVEVGVAVVGGRVDAPQGSELAEPEHLLPVGGAKEEVAALQLFVEYVGGVGDLLGPLGGRQFAALLELFEVHGVVDVDDQYLATRSQRVEDGHGVALEHDHVGPLLELAERGIVAGAHVHDTERGVDLFGTGEGD